MSRTRYNRWVLKSIRLISPMMSERFWRRSSAAAKSPSAPASGRGILLKADEGVTDCEIVEALDCGDTTPYKVRKRYADRGVDAIYHKQPDRTYERKIDGDAEARLFALTCRCRVGSWSVFSAAAIN